jgi:hypothetical protein
VRLLLEILPDVNRVVLRLLFLLERMLEIQWDSAQLAIERCVLESLLGRLVLVLPPFVSDRE